MKIKLIRFMGMLLGIVITSCSIFFPPDKNITIKVDSIALSKTSLSIGIGSVDYLVVTINPKEAKEGIGVTYEYDRTILSVTGDSNGVTISGLRTGNTVLKANAGGKTAACVISVSGVDPIIENTPYISCTFPVVEIEKGTTKKVMVSLSKGSSHEMSLFNWTIDKSEIATIDATGQNAIVTAKQNGTAKITITHPSATYPLELLVFVKPDDEKAIYLTTSQNIISLARDVSNRNVSVSLVNSTTEDQLNGFIWEVLSSESSDPQCISLMSNGMNADIRPIQEGKAIIRVSHPKALYSLDIIVKIINIVENVYIDGPASIVVNGKKTTPVSVSLKGSNKVNSLDPAEFQWTIEDSNYCDFSSFQNEAILSGKKNGTVKLYVSHPAAKYRKEIMVFVENQAEGAVHSGAYITTSQNYIRTKVGAEETSLHISLIGGEIGDEKDLTWSIGDSSIIRMRTSNGQINNMRYANLVQNSYGTSYIEPLTEGTTVITITHPKILTPTEVLVKVLPSYALLEEPITIQGQSTLGLIKGTSVTLSVSLLGSSNPSDEAFLSWQSEDTSVVKVNGSGKEQLITASGNGQTFITITHPKAETQKQILCYVAETQEELSAMKLLYTEKNSYNVITNNYEDVYLFSQNLSEEEIATIKWESLNPLIATITTGDNKTIGRINGISSGKTTILAQLPGLSPIRLSVTVYPEGTSLEVLPPSIYLTTSQNVVQFTTLNSDKTVSVIPVNLSMNEYSGITWTSDNPSIALVTPNGNKATITSKGEGTAIITITHPKSENTLKITVRVGDEYVIINPKDPFITASQDVVGLISGEQGVQISARLENSTASTMFTWTIDDESIATISPLGNKCFIIPKKPGQAQLTIRHANATYDKNVLVLVSNTEEDINGLVYLTTTQNVVRMITGTQQTILTKIMGTDVFSSTDFSWEIDNPSIARITPNGIHAIVTGIQEGVARLKISNTLCKYPLEITLIVTDTIVDASTSPYITSNQNIITVIKNGASKTANIILAGGVEADKSHFVWTVDRPDIIQLTANGSSAVIKGKEAGECRITISHPKALYTFPLVVLVEDPPPSSNLYINPSLPIVEMKPASASQTVTATLVGGSAEDKYGFIWSADNYNVIDLTYSANTAVITPRSEGKAEITISHPKSAYDSKIIVRVTEYSQFAFSQNSMTIPEGSTQFVSMQVPAMEGEYNGRVTYETNNENIVTITGTNKVAQITALSSGTAIVKALAPSGATSELMVYVKKAEQMTAPYITSNTNVLAMKITDNQRSINASIVGEGITQPDQYNLKWEIKDSTIASLIGTSGPNVLVKPLKAGETTITISHPKTNTKFNIYIQVEGSENGVSLNKTYISTETGKTTELIATIDMGTSTDYQNLNWSTDLVNGEEIVSLLGNGKTIAIYALAAGETKVTVEFNGKKATCSVMVSAARQLRFDTESMKIQPGQTRTFKYNLVPKESAINWITNTNDYISYSVDSSSQTITITGIKEGTTKLSAIANSMTCSINIICDWDYRFSIGKQVIVSEPRLDPLNPDKFIIPYTVHPETAEIEVSLSDDRIAAYYIDTVNKQIVLTPKTVGTGRVIVNAVNPYNNYNIGTQTCNLNFYYDSISLHLRKINQNGKYSVIDSLSNSLVLGDGEEIEFTTFTEEENSAYSVQSMVYTQTSTDSNKITLTKDTDTWTIKHPNDQIVYEYFIPQWYDPHVPVNLWNNEKKCVETVYVIPDYIQLGLSDEHWPSNNWTVAWAYSYTPKYPYKVSEDGMGSSFTFGSFGAVGKQANCTFSAAEFNSSYKIRNSSKDGTIMSVSDYESNQWYYGTSTSKTDGMRGHVATVTRGQTGNQPAIKRSSIDTSVKSRVLSGYLTITISIPNSGTKKYTFNVYTETRNCIKD